MSRTVGRIALTRDTTANWNARSTFIPLAGEVIIYTDHSQRDDGNGNVINVPGIKIGDGHAYLIDLPFMEGETSVSVAEKASWNNKVNCALDVIDQEMLVFNRD